MPPRRVYPELKGAASASASAASASAASAPAVAMVASAPPPGAHLSAAPRAMPVPPPALLDSTAKQIFVSSAGDERGQMASIDSALVSSTDDPFSPPTGAQWYLQQQHQQQQSQLMPVTEPQRAAELSAMRAVMEQQQQQQQQQQRVPAPSLGLADEYTSGALDREQEREQRRSERDRRPTDDGLPRPMSYIEGYNMENQVQHFDPTSDSAVPSSYLRGVVYSDRGNAPPRYARWSSTVIPLTQDIQRYCGVPVSVLLHPFAQRHEREDDVPAVEARRVMRCATCAAYVNAFDRFLDGGHLFNCSMCRQATAVPPEQFSPLGMGGFRRDRDDKPELTHGVIDLVFGPRGGAGAGAGAGVGSGSASGGGADSSLRYERPDGSVQEERLSVSLDGAVVVDASETGPSSSSPAKSLSRGSSSHLHGSAPGASPPASPAGSLPPHLRVPAPSQVDAASCSSDLLVLAIDCSVQSLTSGAAGLFMQSAREVLVHLSETCGMARVMVLCVSATLVAVIPRKGGRARVVEIPLPTDDSAPARGVLGMLGSLIGLASGGASATTASGHVSAGGSVGAGAAAAAVASSVYGGATGSGPSSSPGSARAGLGRQSSASSLPSASPDAFFVPFPVHTLPLLSDVVAELDDVLASAIPRLYPPEDSMVNEFAFGAALRLCAAMGRLSKRCVRVVAVASQLPNSGPGALVRRDAALRLNATDTEESVLLRADKRERFWPELAIELVESCAVVDIVACSPQFFDVATVSQVCKLTGGQLRLFSGFSSGRDGELVRRWVHHVLAQRFLHSIVMRVRAPQELALSAVHGHVGSVRMRDSTLWVNGMRADSSVLLVFDHRHRLLEHNDVVVQIAVSFKEFGVDAAGSASRLRVITTAARSSEYMAPVFKNTDMETLLCTALRRACLRLANDTVTMLREQIVHDIVQVLSVYRQECAGGSAATKLVVPETLRCTPLYLLGLLKSRALRPGADIRVDERVAWLHWMTSCSSEQLLDYICPRLYAVHTWSSHTVAGTESPSGSVYLPRPLPLTSDELEPHGVYVLDDGMELILFVGRRCSTELLMDLFNVADVASVPTGFVDALPQTGQFFNVRLARVLDELQKLHRPFPPLRITVDDDPMSWRFHFRLVEDARQASVSYRDFIVYMHKQIMRRTHES